MTENKHDLPEGPTVEVKPGRGFLVVAEDGSAFEWYKPSSMWRTSPRTFPSARLRQLNYLKNRNEANCIDYSGLFE